MFGTVSYVNRKNNIIVIRLDDDGYTIAEYLTVLGVDVGQQLYGELDKEGLQTIYCINTLEQFEVVNRFCALPAHRTSRLLEAHFSER